MDRKSSRNMQMLYGLSYVFTLAFFVLYRFLLYPSLNRLYQDTGADYRLLVTGSLYAPVIIVSTVIFFRVIFHSLSKPWNKPFLYDGIELAAAVIVLVIAYMIDRSHKKYAMELVFVCSLISNLLADVYFRKMNVSH